VTHTAFTYSMNSRQPELGRSEWTLLLTAIAGDLHRGQEAGHQVGSLVIPGDHCSPEVHALAHQLNAALGNVGKTVFYTEPLEPEPTIQRDSIAALMDDLRANKVDMLLILGGNPVYNAPADAGFAQHIEKVETRIHVGQFFNETAAYCHWHVNESHYLEAWSDARAHDGTVSIMQPLIAPLYGGKSQHEILAALGPNPEQSSYEIVRQYWQTQHAGGDFEMFWRRSLHDGFVATGCTKNPPGYPCTGLAARFVTPKSTGESPASTRPAAAAGHTQAKPAATQTNPAGESPASTQAKPTQAKPTQANSTQPLVLTQAGSIEINFRPDPTIYDGRFANNAWLQELDKPLSTLTWDNAIWIGPALAQRLKLEYQDVVEVSVGGSKMQGAIYVQPGHPDNSATVFLGYGRERAGHTGNGAGFNPYPLRANNAPWIAYGELQRVAGAQIQLAKIQVEQMEGHDLVRTATLQEFKNNPSFAHEHAEEPALTLYPEVKYEGYKWGMSIDTTKCVGCNSCIVACQAENNIPVVGKEEVLKRRAMHWLRVDTYYEGLDNPKMHFQPVPCMQCENAPCEYVCPVGATVHSSEGLNDMVYNRCVGTRYCSNNCPYKVRRFNFLRFQDWETPQLKMMRNPDVTVRSRGVMEKCTYCVQRINQHRIDAEREDSKIADGELQTACQQSCPATAIVFGNINDPDSRVSKLKAHSRNYGLLADLNTRPRTTYLAEVRNLNPELKEKSEPR